MQTRKALAPALVVLGVGLAVTGCTNGPSYPDNVGSVGTFGNLAKPALSVSGWQGRALRDSAVGVMPGAPITVNTRDGLLSDVDMEGPDGRVPGRMIDGGQRWQSNGTLSFGAHYSLTAAARGVAGERAQKVGFTTSSASSFASPSTVIGDGETVGVGQSVPINFDAPVANRLNAQRAITVTTDPPVEGAFYWLNDSMVRWRPEHFFAPGTKVSVSVKVKGIDLGNGVFGENNLTSHFTIGRRLVAIADDKTKQIVVYINNKPVRTMATSMGKDSTPTNTGVYIVAERVPQVIMDSSTYGVPVKSAEGYREVVFDASRISFSGIYVHSAPWSVGQQGYSDVSNGCLNVSPDNARWFRQNTLRGDVVIVKNTVGPPLPGDDGLGDWNIPWSVWKKGNA
ncbi:MAG TPA: Ig-like domain-containing protein [Gordonia sp. (in: high G+C Gram-positive bacteria)]|mgnify:CR=1 FL=1|uniref:L,D-transpeptidase n=1 Tax=unclassified Gordonia (in: high G+C Gram-positive bacteria) TaxID=2657482 RepID=UPI000FA27411|nr:MULTISPECIES: Ig-like domain-containing protein [unclassified Gordonia (in: high G+C Gram-positive bacteria)]RUP40805.1 MAG: hypothetical protein EKK60_03010 [Gordonia sp. (in: high G+C Gram-positive bacteria)]HNP57442.1 Ig-like domain-containing protein [Gordonia sp. (in: high G+C Gram-positive bacteria)]HRC50865.1 Ig-like domain-containing protein [Gordonia sp. (in: high G+C Gram-positive bacteria)]